jgi:hypothetical protein
MKETLSRKPRSPMKPSVIATAAGSIWPALTSAKTASASALVIGSPLDSSR